MINLYPTAEVSDTPLEMQRIVRPLWLAHLWDNPVINKRIVAILQQQLR
jgi:hypothetical protein